MREILFRGKRTDGGGWIEGDLSTRNLEGTPMIYTDFNDNYKVTCVGQYTGQKDSTGNKIFEGDLVEWDGNSMDVYEIIYGGDASFFGVPINGKLERVAGESLSLLNADIGLVVVGNVHDIRKEG